MGSNFSISRVFSSSTELEIEVKGDKDFTFFSSHLFSGIFSKKDETFLVYYVRSATLKTQERITIEVEITTENSKTQTTVCFTKNQNNFLLKNVSAPFKIKIITDQQVPHRAKVPHVGIRNLGLTCYINSSLQLLFSCSPFTQLIFDQDQESDGVASGLQKVFVDLYTSPKAISIASFVKSFGDFFQMIAHEQDAHEFITGLLDKIDTELGKEFVEKREEIMSVVESRVLECKAANVKNEVNETGNEIQVTVSGFDNLIDSLRDLTATEELTGANKWDTGSELGKQDAKRYVKYKKLPKVLLFQLIRFAYNKYTGRVEEVTSFFECPNELDMKEFCLPEVDKTKYTLTAVLAHRGDPMSGHYITYAQPKHDGNWYVFNDSSVTHVSFEEVHRTFGGPTTIMTNLLSCIGYGNFISYVVAYVRNDQLMQPVNVPASIAPFLTDTITVKLITKENMNQSSSSLKIIGVSKTDTIEDIFPVKQENVYYFISIPGIKAIQGPIEATLKCESILIPGVTSTIFALPQEAGEKPVFLFKDETFSVMPCSQLFEEHAGETLVCEHRIVTSVDDVYRGAVVSILPKEINLKLGEKEFTVSPETTYEELQEKVSSKNPGSILFTSQMLPILPVKYPTAYDISTLPELSVSILPEPATVYSLDLFQRAIVEFYDAAHNQRKTIVWVPKSSNYENVASQLKKTFNIKSGEIVLSSSSQTEISRILAPGSVMRENVLRADLVDGSISLSISSVSEKLKSNNKASVEVRVASLSGSIRKYRTCGFIRVSSKTTGDKIAKEVGVEDPSSFIVRSARDPSSATTFAGTTQMSALFGSIAKGTFSDRPVIVIRQHSKKSK